LQEGGGVDDRATVPLYRVPSNWVANDSKLARVRLSGTFPVETERR